MPGHTLSADSNSGDYKSVYRLTLYNAILPYLLFCLETRRTLCFLLVYWDII